MRSECERVLTEALFNSDTQPHLPFVISMMLLYLQRGMLRTQNRVCLR